MPLGKQREHGGVVRDPDLVSLVHSPVLVLEHLDEARRIVQTPQETARDAARRLVRGTCAREELLHRLARRREAAAEVERDHPK